MMKKAILAGVVAIAVTTVPQVVSAAPFVGQVGYGGSVGLPGAGGFDDEANLVILSAIVTGSTGSFAAEGLSAGDPLVHATPLTYQPVPVLPAGPIWTHVASGISFVLTSFTVTSISDLAVSLEGVGYFTGAGYDDTPGVWAMSAQSGIGTVPSATYLANANVPEPEPVPEPASLAVLGLGLVGVGAARRRGRR
jgi:hypothetical protein